jgi:hypothetical protein
VQGVCREQRVTDSSNNSNGFNLWFKYSSLPNIGYISNIVNFAVSLHLFILLMIYIFAYNAEGRHVFNVFAELNAILILL